MKIEQLVASLDRPQRTESIQCEFAVNAPYPEWRVRRYAERGLDPSKCCKQAVVRLDGKAYCMVHGGKLAILELINQERNK